MSDSRISSIKETLKELRSKYGEAGRRPLDKRAISKPSSGEALNSQVELISNSTEATTSSFRNRPAKPADNLFGESNELLYRSRLRSDYGEAALEVIAEEEQAIEDAEKYLNAGRTRAAKDALQYLKSLRELRNQLAAEIKAESKEFEGPIKIRKNATKQDLYDVDELDFDPKSTAINLNSTRALKAYARQVRLEKRYIAEDLKSYGDLKDELNSLVIEGAKQLKVISSDNLSKGDSPEFLALRISDALELQNKQSIEKESSSKK
jgi:hypothetical protein